MVLFLLIEMAGNNTVAAAENGTDVEGKEVKARRTKTKTQVKKKPF